MAKHLHLCICLIVSMLYFNFARAGNVPPQSQQHQAIMPNSGLPGDDREENDVIIMEEDENFEEGDMEKQDDDEDPYEGEKGKPSHK